MSMIPDICSMHILLAAATPFEIQPTISLLEGPLSHPEHTTTILITGVGGLATVYSLTRQIDRQRPDLVIQAGIAGCFTGRPATEVVIVGEEVLADLGVWEEGRFQSLFDLRLAEKNTGPFSDGLLKNPYPHLLQVASLAIVRGITVNEITTDPIRIRWLQQNIAPVVESMEGGGFHYVCLQEGIPFIQLRAISNEVGVRDKTRWDIRGAITALNERLTLLYSAIYKNDNHDLYIRL